MFLDIVTDDSSKIWPGGIVPCFYGGLPDGLKKDAKDAIKFIEGESSLRFIEKTNQDINYIHFREGEEFGVDCVGMNGGKQLLYASVKKKYRRPVGHFMHEILHSVGFHHEHCRSDRCEHLIVDKKVSEDINFKELSSEDWKSYGPYDYNSIMHYPEGPNMKLKEEIKDVKIGQRERLSEGDIHALNRLYPPGECFRYLIQELGGFISTQPESSYEEAIYDSNSHSQRAQYFGKLQYYLERVQHMYGLHQKHYPNECTCAFGDVIQYLKKVTRGSHMPNIECQCCKINNPVHDAFGNTSEDVFEEFFDNNIQCLKRWVEDYLNANNEREQKVKRKRGEELDIKESEEENTIKKKPKKEQK